MPFDSTYNTYTDEQLVEWLKNGDEEAFTEIYQRYAETLYHFAWNILQEEDECADAVQEVFIWFWENRQKLQVTTLKYYLLAAVKYKLIRTIQNSKRRDQILAARPQTTLYYAEETLELQELKAIIDHFTEALPPRAKEIFHLSREEYLTNREIASKLHISEKTVENQITIALKKLRHTLGNLSFWSVFL
jgi:RNA polymerase sigma-70 factor (ECF subfamily)